MNNRRKSHPPKPILVLNEYTNRHVNVEPLLWMGHDNYRSIDRIAEELDLQIQFVATSIDLEIVTPEAWRDCLTFLYSLRDTLRAMNEV